MRKGGEVMEYGIEQLASFISDSQAAFINGQLQQAFSLATLNTIIGTGYYKDIFVKFEELNE